MAPSWAGPGTALHHRPDLEPGLAAGPGGSWDLEEHGNPLWSSPQEQPLKHCQGAKTTVLRSGGWGHRVGVHLDLRGRHFTRCPGPRGGGDEVPNWLRLPLLRIPVHPLPTWGLFPRASSSSPLTPAPRRSNTPEQHTSPPTMRAEG